MPSTLHACFYLVGNLLGLSTPLQSLKRLAESNLCVFTLSTWFFWVFERSLLVFITKSFPMFVHLVPKPVLVCPINYPSHRNPVCQAYRIVVLLRPRDVHYGP